MNPLYIGHPQVRVTISAQYNLIFSYHNVLSSHGDHLISVQTSKDVRQPAGSFSLVIAPSRLAHGQDYRDVLRPGDLVTIEMGPDKPQPPSDYQKTAAERQYSGLEIVMIGTIDDVRMSTNVNPSDGKIVRTMVASGRDFAKYLIDDQIWWDSWSQPSRALSGLRPDFDEWLRAKTAPAAYQPAGLMHALLLYYQNHFDVTFWQGRTAGRRHEKLFRDMLRMKATTDTPMIAIPESILSYEGAPWALMERTAGPPLFTLQYDVRRRMDIDQLLKPSGSLVLDNGNTNYWNTGEGRWESQPVLLLYRNPWSNRFYQNDWTDLPTRVMEDSDLMSSDIGRGNEEVSNTWHVWSESQGAYRNLGGVDIGAANTLRDYESIQRYGERPLILTTSYITGQGRYTDIVKKYSYQLKDWNRWNEHYLNGTITMKGMAAVKVGDRLWHWDNDFGHYTSAGAFEGGVDYYVERVVQDFRAFTGWTTTVQVTRGQKHREHGDTISFLPDVSLSQQDFENNSADTRKKLDEAAEQVRVWARNKPLL